jgi:hypothetical protein
MKDFPREAEMEELHRTHKDVPFGWLLALQQLLGAMHCVLDALRRSSRRAVRVS